MKSGTDAFHDMSRERHGGNGKHRTDVNAQTLPALA
jgi:hypothetical protein